MLALPLGGSLEDLGCVLAQPLGRGSLEDCGCVLAQPQGLGARAPWLGGGQVAGWSRPQKPDSPKLGLGLPRGSAGQPLAFHNIVVQPCPRTLFGFGN